MHAWFTDLADVEAAGTAASAVQMSAAVAAVILIERYGRILGFIRRTADHAREIWGIQIARGQRLIDAKFPRTFVASDALCPPAPRYLVHKRSRHRAQLAGARPQRGCAVAAQLREREGLQEPAARGGAGE